jgi:hypothetical protein
VDGLKFPQQILFAEVRRVDAPVPVLALVHGNRPFRVVLVVACVG